MNNFYQKYLKYKQKYLLLKQRGGGYKKIYTNKFNPIHQDEIVKYVIENSGIENLLGSGSNEGGFSLSYSRILNFFKDDIGNICGFNTRYDDVYSEEELETIKKYVNEAIGKLKDNKINELPIPSGNTEISINPFPEDKRIQLAIKVITTCNIPNLSINGSREGGFSLPRTDEWNYVDLQNKKYLYYSEKRELRFKIRDEFVVGLRTPNDINYFTDNELKQISECVNKATKEI